MESPFFKTQPASVDISQYWNNQIYVIKGLRMPIHVMFQNLESTDCTWLTEHFRQIHEIINPSFFCLFSYHNNNCIFTIFITSILFYLKYSFPIYFLSISTELNLSPLSSLYTLQAYPRLLTVNTPGPGPSPSRSTTIISRQKRKKRTENQQLFILNLTLSQTKKIKNNNNKYIYS